MYIRTVELYSAIKQNKLLIHATTRRNLKGVMVNDWHQIERTAYCMVPFTGNPRTGKLYEQKADQISCCQGLGVRGSHSLERGTKVFWEAMEIFSIIISLVLIWMWTFVKIHQIVHLKSVTFIQCKLCLKIKNKREHLRSCSPACQFVSNKLLNKN